MARQKITALLLIGILLSGIVSCGGDGKTNDQTTTTSDSEPVETADPLLPSDTKKYDGRTFTVLTTEKLGNVYSEEQNGSPVNDAIYERDRRTEEELDVKINFHSAGPTINDVYPAVKASVMAGDKDYDLIIAHTNYDLTSYVSDDLILDWNTVPHVDFEKVYWNSNIIDQLSINGRSPYAVSDIYIGDTVFLLLNKKLAEDMRLGNLYDYVYDGKWTWELLSKISADITGDVDGNGEMDSLDRYGVVSNVAGSAWLLRNIPGSCGQMIYKNGKDGLELVVNNEKTQKILEMANSLFHGGGGYFLEAGEVVGNGVEEFNRGTYLTYFVSSGSAAMSFNNLDFDYGVLPLPKYDEAQENYCSISWSNNIMIPRTADADFSGMVAEWMSYYGNRLIRPKFYNSLMSVRFAQDEETVDMLDIIFNSIDFDPGMSFKSANFYFYFDNMVRQGSSDFASYYQSSLASELDYIERLNTAFESFGK